MHNSGEEEESRSGIWEAGNFLVKAAELHYDKKIASGNYGTVYKGKCRGYNVGIKLLHNQHLNEQKIEELKREVEIMSSLRHPCILLLMGVCTEKEKLALVMEYVEGRDLEHVIHDPGVPLTVQHQLKIAKGIAQGMNWLHCLKPIPIIHRDLKPPNILVTKDFEVKVCDFGLSCVKEKFDPKAPPKDKAVGTPVWMAPEILCGMPASEKSDVYAYGLVLWELFTRKERPFAHVTSFAEFCDDVIDRHVRPTLTDDIPPEVQRLIRKCWAPNMNDRPLFGAVIEFLDDIFVDTLVKDPAARELWKRLNRKEGYPDRVKWEDFVTVLTSALGIRPDNPQFLFQPNSPSYNCVREFLTEADKDLTSSESEKNRIVTCENWGRFVEVFGPYHDKILQNFCDLCRKGCFHGSIDAKEAERRLSSEKPGAYLIRLSSKDNCISISKRVRSGGHFNHQRAHKEGSRFAIVVNGQIHNFSLLTEFLESPQAKSKSEGLGLKRPCFAHSPFAKFFGLGTGDVVCYIETDLVRQAIGGSGSGSNPGDQKSGGSSGSGSSSSGRKKKSGKKE